MDCGGMLAHPVQAVFGHLAEPARLGDWLPEVTGIRADAGAVFTLRLRRRDGTTTAATGELIAHEPPWSVAYRLLAGPDTHVLRLTCTATGAGTQVNICQAGPAQPLAIDLARLRQVMAGRPHQDAAAQTKPRSGPASRSGRASGPA
jgi:uncharacterized protein YndB with AHSA1/START domain